jgi:DNA-directed RNA polymerase subunit RPC12/RpoP
MGKWKPRTFEHDGCKDIHCSNCGRYLKHDSRIIDIKERRIECPDCGTSNIIYPPRKAKIEDKDVILFKDSKIGRDPMECTFTADKTI